MPIVLTTSQAEVAAALGRSAPAATVPDLRAYQAFTDLDRGAGVAIALTAYRALAEGSRRGGSLLAYTDCDSDATLQLRNGLIVHPDGRPARLTESFPATLPARMAWIPSFRRNRFMRESAARIEDAGLHRTETVRLLPQVAGDLQSLSRLVAAEPQEVVDVALELADALARRMDGGRNTMYSYLSASGIPGHEVSMPASLLRLRDDHVLVVAAARLNAARTPVTLPASVLEAGHAEQPSL